MRVKAAKHQDLQSEVNPVWGRFEIDRADRYMRRTIASPWRHPWY